MVLFIYGQAKMIKEAGFIIKLNSIPSQQIFNFPNIVANNLIDFQYIERGAQ